jgi:hypothetical protein
VGAGVGAIRTEINFDDDQTYELEQQAITAFGGYTLRSGWSLRLSAGVITGGSLESDDAPVRFDLRPGGMIGFAGSRQWTPGDGRWFVTGTGSFSIALASTRPADGSDGGGPSERFLAGDLRIGAIAGRTFADRISPYLLARAFGGPVFWTIAGDSVSGGDASHVQLGAGVSVTLPWQLTATVDVSALGEQAVSLGISRRL